MDKSDKSEIEDRIKGIEDKVDEIEDMVIGIDNKIKIFCCIFMIGILLFIFL